MAGRACVLFHVVMVIYYVRLDFHLLGYVLPMIETNIPDLGRCMMRLLVQYGTIWTAVIHNLYYLGCIVEHALDAASAAPRTRAKLINLTDSIFVNIMWPISVVVSIDFWVLFNMDPLLIENHGVFFKYISRPVNHALHTCVVLVGLLEICTRRHATFPVDVLRSAQSQAKVLGFYFLTLAVVQPFTPVWTYPFFEKLGPVHWVLFVTANLVLSTTAQVAGKALSDRLWASPSHRHGNAALVDNYMKKLD